jgi:hypothetical protein
MSQPENELTPPATAPAGVPGVQALPVAQEAPKEGAAAAAGISIIGAAIVSAAVSITLVVSGLMIYDRHFTQRPRPLATVDIDAIVSARELALVERLSRAGATDADHGQTFELISAFGSQMEAAVNQTTRECGCDILVRGALVGRSSLDLTDQIASRLGIAPEAVAEGRTRIRSTIAAASIAARQARPIPSMQPSTTETRP